VVKAKPELAKVPAFKAVLSGDREAMARLSLHDLEEILVATLTGMSVDDFEAEAKKWHCGTVFPSETARLDELGRSRVIRFSPTGPVASIYP
jgi:hypothetical protein